MQLLKHVESGRKRQGDVVLPPGSSTSTSSSAGGRDVGRLGVSPREVAGLCLREGGGRSPIPSFHFQKPARRTYQLPGLLRSTPFILKDTTVRIVFVAGFFPIRREKRYAAPDVSCYQLVHFLSLRYEKAAQCNAIRLDACLTGISSRFKFK